MRNGQVGSIFVGPGTLSGTVKAPASKSFAHRALICAALSGGSSLLTNIDLSKDILATMQCLQALGFAVQYQAKDRTISVGAAQQTSDDDCATLHCGESGSTLRFLIPLAAALGRETIFTGEGRLPQRPIGEFNSIFHQKGVQLETTNGMLPLHIRGKLTAGVYHVSGKISSQYITGLLLALPILASDSEIKLLTPLESAPYIDVTIAVMESFGVQVIRTADGFQVPGRQVYKARTYEVEGDYSQAAFWLTANYLGSTLAVTGLNDGSVQGDRAICDVLEQIKNGTQDVAQERTIDVAQIPDLVPILAGAAALTPGVTRFINAGRLRIKESDRLAAVTDVLRKLGADIQEFPEQLVVKGKDALRGGQASAWDDHRIAMMLAVVALRTKNGVTIDGFSCVEKSYPSFFQEFARLGGTVNELNLG